MNSDHRNRSWFWPVIVIAVLANGACGGPDAGSREPAPVPAPEEAEEVGANLDSPESTARQRQLEEWNRREKFKKDWDRRVEEFMASSDKDSEEARQALEKEYEAAQRAEYLRQVKEVVDSTNRDFEFSGRVIDQDGAPLPGVAVEALISVVRDDLTSEHDFILVTTDTSGSFSLKGRGTSIRLSFVKSGYRFSQNSVIGLDRMSDAELARLNRGDQPMTFRARREPSEPSGDVRIGLKYHKVVADGSFQGADIERWPDLVQVSMTRAAGGTFSEPSSWSAALRIGNGEIQKAPSQRLDEAPESGYAPQWSASYEKGSDNWAKSKVHTFFFRSDDERVHGGLTVFFRPYYNTREESSVAIDYRLNVTGSRNLLSMKDR
ncbi:MAG: carboxypeptidase-like regulatory domain-containing protein [Acidobacteriota bacterium]|nr:carboxypeptidase-like regulatory domain-containing protein [Acidobacteriota bacterium]